MDWTAALPWSLRPRRAVLVYVDLVQDIDVLEPVIAALMRSRKLRPVVRVARWLRRESPRTEAALRRLRVPFAYVRRQTVVAGGRPSLRGVRAVLTAAESSHPAHAGAHALARRARALGLGAYTLQHGLENIGLYGLEAADAVFASDHVFCWFPPEATPAKLPGQTGPKLIHVGRPLASVPSAGLEYDLGVFENLHWERYSEADRDRFRAGLEATAAALPSLRILVRPHPAGGWGEQLRDDLSRFGNVVLARPAQARASAETGAEAVRRVRRVVTTPSTIALDAAIAGAPVALAAPGGEVYAPLPVLETPEAWIAFARGAADPPGAIEAFRARVLLPGDASPRIVERLEHDLR